MHTMAEHSPHAKLMNTVVPHADLPAVAECGLTSKKIIVRDLNFYYQNDSQALKNVSMEIYEHRVTALMGPSGCGKSTLLRVFNRMYDLYPGQRADGEVMFEGENILRIRDIMRFRTKIGMVFQRPTPLQKSIYENVAFGIKLNWHLPRSELDVRVESALRQAALWDEVKDMLAANGFELSGGQQQRLCIARALAMRPDVLLLDEPCSAIDPVSSAKIEQTIKELKNDYTVVIVTHNLQQAARVSDYAGFMFLGELVEFDVARRIFEAPNDPRTQHFISGRIG